MVAGSTCPTQLGCGKGLCLFSYQALIGLQKNMQTATWAKTLESVSLISFKHELKTLDSISLTSFLDSVLYLFLTQSVWYPFLTQFDILDWALKSTSAFVGCVCYLAIDMFTRSPLLSKWVNGTHTVVKIHTICFHVACLLIEVYTVICGNDEECSLFLEHDVACLNTLEGMITGHVLRGQ